jgi:O-methyltransferase
MLNRVKRTLASYAKRRLRRFGVDVHPYPPADIPPWMAEIAGRVEPYTLTSAERIASVCYAVEYVTHNAIPGDVVECGVWRGGSMMAAALSLKHFGDTSRKLHLFDTFEGMTKPGELDREASTGRPAAELLSDATESSPLWAIASLNDVRSNLQSIDYPTDHVRFVPGMVETTIPAQAPDKIAILRLDTDWYESTRHELEHLYPRLVKGGVLIIDDYGYWQGARKAVDEYIAVHKLPVFLHRIDETGRIATKPD